VGRVRRKGWAKVKPSPASIPIVSFGASENLHALDVLEIQLALNAATARGAGESEGEPRGERSALSCPSRHA